MLPTRNLGRWLRDENTSSLNPQHPHKEPGRLAACNPTLWGVETDGPPADRGFAAVSLALGSGRLCLEGIKVESDGTRHSASSSSGFQVWVYPSWRLPLGVHIPHTLTTVSVAYRFRGTQFISRAAFNEANCDQGK